MQIIRVIFLSVFVAPGLLAQNDDWYIQYDPIGSCRYVDGQGDIMIPAGIYEMCFTDTFRTYAIVLAKDKSGFIGIDKAENKLFTVFPFDNGPDYVSDGTFRIIDGSKMGFADTTGKIIIHPIYDFAFPFEKGLALVNIGGHRKKNGEHYVWREGKWGVIDKEGKLLLDLKYDYLWNPDTQKPELVGQNEKFLLENGQVTHVSP